MDKALPHGVDPLMFPTAAHWCKTTTANCKCLEEDHVDKPGVFTARCDPDVMLGLDPVMRAQVKFCESSCMCLSGTA